MDDTLIILRDARSLIAEGFVKHGFAKRGNGAFCKPTDPRAIGYCALGAIYAAAGVETKNAHNAGKKLPDAVYEAIDDVAAIIKTPNIADYNNRWYRTQRGMVRVFDKAIAFREKEATVQVPAVKRERKLETP